MNIFINIKKDSSVSTGAYYNKSKSLWCWTDWPSIILFLLDDYISLFKSKYFSEAVWECDHLIVSPILSLEVEWKLHKSNKHSITSIPKDPNIIISLVKKTSVFSESMLALVSCKVKLIAEKSIIKCQTTQCKKQQQQKLELCQLIENVYLLLHKSVPAAIIA